MAKVKISKAETDIAFDCGNASINELIVQSYYSTILQHAYCYVWSCDKEILGAYMLKFTKIDFNACPESISEYQSGICSDCFSIHIKYIAVNEKYQGHGIGKKMMEYIVNSVMKLCETWPIRLITLDALKEKYEWYISRGFNPFNENDLKNAEPTIHMYMDCLLDEDKVNTYCESLY